MAKSDFERALALQQAGKLEQAERCYRRALKTTPELPSLWFRWAGLLFQRGAYEESAASYARVIALAAKNHLVYYNRGLCLLKIGREEEALLAFAEASRLKPDYAPAHINKTELLRQRQDYRAALQSCQRGLDYQPQSIVLWGQLGAIQFELGDSAAAMTAYGEALRRDSRNVEALHGLGRVQLETGNVDMAMAHYRRALAAVPGQSVLQQGLAQAYEQAGQFASAMALFKRMLQDHPEESARIYESMGELSATQGNILRARQYWNQALLAWRQGLKNSPEDAHVLLLIADLELRCQRWEVAKQACQGLLLREPLNVKAILILAQVQEQQGDYVAAEQCYRQLVALQPEDEVALLSLANILTIRAAGRGEIEAVLNQILQLNADNVFAHCLLMAGRAPKDGDDPRLQGLHRLLRKRPLKPMAEIKLNFSLARAYGSLQQYDESFRYYAAANGLKRRRLNFDIAAISATIADVQALFSVDFFKRHAGYGLRGVRPVFIVGMPRSGSTLVEQIITAHSQAVGAGESYNLPKALFSTETGLKDDDFSAVLDLDKVAVEAMAKDYLQRMSVYSSAGESCITDKMLGNFMHIGFIRLLFPDARVIHCRRNPVATCWSCYTQDFLSSLNYSCDLEELGLYYRQYAALMQHWDAVLPGYIMSIDYEDVVAEQETQTRRLLAFCDLPWDAACLSFHRSVRAVNTASVEQVRAPLYTAALQQWRCYEGHLQPLLTALASD